MKKKQKTSKMTWFLQHRLMVFLIIVFVGIPLVLIPSIYLIEYNSAKPTLFEDTSAKIIDVDDLEDLAIDYRISEMREPTEALVGGYYKVAYTITKKASVNTISDVKITFQLSTTWAAYSSNSFERQVTLGQSKTEQIMFNFDLEQDVLPFVKLGGPYLYAKITYTETILNEPFNRTVYIRLPYDLVEDNTTIIPN